MAEECTPARPVTSENGRHPAPLLRKTGVADRVDALVNSVQAAVVDTIRYRRRHEPDLSELPGCDHSVLAGGDSRRLAIGRGSFFRHG